MKKLLKIVPFLLLAAIFAVVCLRPAEAACSSCQAAARARAKARHKAKMRQRAEGARKAEIAVKWVKAMKRPTPPASKP